MIRQGEVYWLDLGMPGGSEPGFRRPYVVIQNDLHNGSDLSTTVVVALTSNLKRALFPGNVLLERGEAGLPESSVVNRTQIATVDKAGLDAPIGKVSVDRMNQILEGIHLLLDPF